MAIPPAPRIINSDIWLLPCIRIMNQSIRSIANLRRKHVSGTRPDPRLPMWGQDDPQPSRSGPPKDGLFRCDTPINTSHNLRTPIGLRMFGGFMGYFGHFGSERLPI